ncbi:MAG: GyrI-like domain-containing protein [bacterium]
MSPKTVNFKGYFYTLTGLFFMFAPVFVPYDKIYHKAKEAGYQVDSDFGLLERGTFIGPGKIGVKVGPKKDQDTSKLTLIEGDFKVYEHKGSYKKLGDAFKTIMQENPESKTYYSIYKNSPNVVKEEDLLTEIWVGV